MNQQRELIYSQRREVLDGADLKEKLLGMLTKTVETETALAFSQKDEEGNIKLDSLNSIFSMLLKEGEKLDAEQGEEAICELLHERAMKLYQDKEELFKPDVFREVERVALLSNVDRKWMDHIDAMDDLKNSIGLRAYGQRDPVIEYKMVSGDMFAQMIDDIRTDTVLTLLRAFPHPNAEVKRESVAKITGTSHGGTATPVKKQPVRNTKKKVGRNELCPCGSGIKYKLCCGRNENGETN
jgi:preprotein translocase subunit SecA